MKLLNNTQTAALLGIKPNTLEIWRVHHKGPRFIKYGEGSQAPVRYDEQVVLAWLEAQTRSSTTDHNVRMSASA